MTRASDVLLTVRNLTVDFDTAHGTVAAVKGVDLTLARGEVVCLVGESGSGKSVTGFSLMGLVDPPGRVAADAMEFDGRDLLRASDREKDALRGKDIAMVFQEPMTALNPGRTVGSQIAEVLRIHGVLGRRAAWERAVALLDRVGIREPAQRARAYPHELSGGMRQRVMIAIACALTPKLIIADEPTTALDVTVQAQVLQLLFSIQAETGAAVLFITHDLGVVAEIADRVVVMQAGRVVETGEVTQIFNQPRHPYTQALLAAVPDVDAPRDPARRLAPKVGELAAPDVSAEGATP
ncbi:ABC transporter ATP-binding protein [Achromobacter sp. DH1f]|uniref:ABC transporter ATP-binding protein n=1 Tax=Achromobacter sp. DH1f TaxID=1397275 RepID=UPI000690A3C1|nr:ABC transporter ATP-binding protein [Achromobacter sp. DH1f]